MFTSSEKTFCLFILSICLSIRIKSISKCKCLSILSILPAYKVSIKTINKVSIKSISTLIPLSFVLWYLCPPWVRRMLFNDTSHFANDLNACFNDTRSVLFTFTDTFYRYFTDTFYRYFIGWQNRQNGQTFTFTDTFYSNRQTNRQNKQAESFFEWREHCIQYSENYAVLKKIMSEHR